MATKRKTEAREEIHITIYGPQGSGKMRLAVALARLVGGETVDGGYIECHPATGRARDVKKALLFMASRKPYEKSGPRIIITTSNK